MSLPPASGSEGDVAVGSTLGARSAAIESSLQAGRWPESIRALRLPEFRRYWLGQLVSLCGTWMQATAQGWLVLEMTGSATALGLVTSLQFLPITFLSLVGGFVADRWPKRQVLLWLNVAAMLQSSIFTWLVFAEQIAYWHVCILAIWGGIVAALEMPTRQAITSDLADAPHLANAIAVNSLSFNLARILGPACAGLLIGWGGVGPALALNALSYLASICALISLRAIDTRHVQHSAGRSLLSHLGELVSFVRHQPLVGGIFCVVAAAGLFGFNFNVLFPLLAGPLLHLDAVGLGFLTSSFGIGALAGAFSTAVSKEVNLRRGGLFALGFVGLLFALSSVRGMSSACLVMAGVGMAGIAMATTFNTLLQLATPASLRGRIMSVWVFLFMGSAPLGNSLTGWLADALGIRGVILFNATAMLVGLLVGWRVIRANRLDPSDRST